MIGCALLAFASAAAAAEPENRCSAMKKSLYDLLDLERPGIKNVKKAVEKGNIPAADKGDCSSISARANPCRLFGLDLENIKVSKLEQRQADWGPRTQVLRPQGAISLLLLRRRHQLAILARQRTTNSAGSCTATTGSSRWPSATT